MPQDLGPDADPRTVDDLITKMLMFFEQQQAPNGPQVPSLSTRGNIRPPVTPPAPLNNPYRIWGNEPNTTGRMPPDDTLEPEF
jgi:hypothetical protein